MNKIIPPKKKILIIDDNPGILFALQKALELDGYEVDATAVFEGAEGVSISSPDLIFLDIFLASQDGREITRELKGCKGTKHIPIVILSAYPGIEELAKEAGADDHLAKPFELAALFALAKKHTA
jgi:two-component system alkaline phosphatase synthesis response regulator PhoP/two-component system response regulator MtrA